MSGSFTHNHLRSMNGDVQRQMAKISSRNHQWVLKNMLPSDLTLFCEKEGSGTPKFLTILNSHKTISFPPNTFADRDQLYVFIKQDGKLILFTEPYMFREIWKNIVIGAATYNSDSGNGGVHATHWDMRGVWLNNFLRVPIDVYYKNSLVAQIGAYDGLTYHGGGSSSIYFDNSREGLDLGDKLVFRYNNGLRMFDIVLDDEQALSIDIGKVSGGQWGPSPDNASYRLGNYSYTGITYYDSISGYTSRKTNPYAPY